MRAYEFVNEQQAVHRKPAILVPKDPKRIEQRKEQYDLLKKRAEWLSKLADVKKKLRDDWEQSEKIVKTMANRALKKRGGKQDLI